MSTTSFIPNEHFNYVHSFVPQSTRTINPTNEWQEFKEKAAHLIVQQALSQIPSLQLLSASTIDGHASVDMFLEFEGLIWKFRLN